MQAAAQRLRERYAAAAAGTPAASAPDGHVESAAPAPLVFMNNTNRTVRMRARIRPDLFPEPTATAGFTRLEFRLAPDNRPTDLVDSAGS